MAAPEGAMAAPEGVMPTDAVVEYALKLYRDKQREVQHHAEKVSKLTKELAKFFPYTETTEKATRSEKKYNILYIISFCPVLVFMVLVLSTCSAVSPEQLRPHLDSSLMQVRCPTSLLALRQGDCVFEMTTNPFNPENSEM